MGERNSYLAMVGNAPVQDILERYPVFLTNPNNLPIPTVTAR
ncbi:hypothetical protein THF5H11_10397 [Vibrio jasicida]|nr:hypothetical protein THF5H11_10397 [Vibrio jasicida]